MWLADVGFLVLTHEIVNPFLWVADSDLSWRGEFSNVLASAKGYIHLSLFHFMFVLERKRRFRIFLLEGNGVLPFERDN